MLSSAGKWHVNKVNLYIVIKNNCFYFISIDFKMKNIMHFLSLYENILVAISLLFK